MQPSLRFNHDLSLDVFIAEYWQKRPLLMRNAIDPALLTFPPEELAGLACEESVESRLIQQSGETAWHMQHGPLEEETFSQLPDSRWTLLVQDVDKHVPEVARLLGAFDFLPDWRIDDIMISYATNEGGVGPHTDNYDVFLLQAQGKRRWRLSEHEYTDDDLLADCPLRVLREFDTSEDWTLHPGDVLYLPPRLAHWGTAVGDCMTWSIGMRGPSQDEMLDAWLQYRSERGNTRYFHDQLIPGRVLSDSILEPEIERARMLMNEMLPEDNEEFRRWFACFVTEPKPDFEIAPLKAPLQPDQLKAQVADGEALVRHPWARFACISTEHSQAFCAQGECFDVPKELEKAFTSVCGQRRLASEVLLTLEPQAVLWPWLTRLFNRGLLIFDD